MVLSTLASDILLSRPQLRKKISKELGIKDQMIMQHRRINKNNNPLTTAGVVRLIEQEGLTEEQILVEAPKKIKKSKRA